MKVDRAIIIRPAKRVIVLYVLAFVLVLGILILALGQLRQLVNLDMFTGAFIWKAFTITGLGLLCYAILWRLTSVFTVSADSVASTIGILSKTHIRIPLNRIVDYRVVTPLLERILGIGSVHIDTAGDEDLVMQQISQPDIDLMVVKLDKLLNKEQRGVANTAGTGR